MIFVRRPVTPPRTLASPAAREATLAAKRLGPQQRAVFDESIYAADDVRSALEKTFSNKCAYCEQGIPLTEMEVDHFRPMGGALGLEGDFSLEHYPWLAYEWTNLYSTCRDCGTTKGLRFPVGASRASLGATGAELLAEEPLFLDPCHDDPQGVLIFAEDGTVSSEDRRGQVTIEVLGLNRESLIRARILQLAFLQGEWLGAQTRLAAGESAEDIVKELTSAGTPFAALCRQFVGIWSRQDRHRRAPQRPEDLISAVLGSAAVAAAVAIPLVTKKRMTDSRESYEAFQRAQQQYSVKTSKPSTYFLTSRQIQRIEIRNFRVIEDLTLRFPTTPGTQASWLMLLGENGTGKSSVLQAIALALMGRDYRNRLKLDPKRILRRGTEEGFVKVFLNGLTEPVELTFGKRSRRFGGKPAEPRVLLLGYGATRHLPAMKSRTPSPDFASVDNLFDPFVPLKDARAWMYKLRDSRFDAVARALKSMLPAEASPRFVRIPGKGSRPPHIEVEGFGLRFTLDDMSDGYESVLALVADVMQVLFHQWDAMEAAEGVVLVDEIEAHLHPRWKMRIVDSLRSAFPRVQFIVSTHDPLCLRGLHDGEVVVMRWTPTNQVYAVTDLPAVAGLPVDQLLMSEAFGLDSTIDPRVDALFQEYYRLKGAATLTPSELARLKNVEAQVSRYRSLGGSRQDRLVLEAADEWSAKERTIVDPKLRQELTEQTKRKLAEIWSAVEPPRSATT